MKSTGEPLFLSHVLSDKTVGYGGKKTFASNSVLALSRGDSCNQSHWTLSNHIGTHIDAPFHFCNSGKTIDHFSAKDWIFRRPQLIELPAKSGDIIDVGDWCQNLSVQTDLLLIKTGFEKERNLETYWSMNPGLSPELGIWLRKERPQLRAIGFDFISITSYLHRDLGKKAHREFLSVEKMGQPLLAIEDMHLENLTTSPARVTIVPLRVENADGSPVTVIAEF